MFLFNFIQTFQTIQSFFPGLLVGYIVLRHRNNEETPRKNLAKKFLIFIVVLLYSLALYFTIAKQVQHLSICFSVFSVYLSVYMSVCLSVFHFHRRSALLPRPILHHCETGTTYVYLSVCLLCLSVCLPVRLSIFVIFIVGLLYSLALYYDIAKQVHFLSIYLSFFRVCLSAYPSVCFDIFIVFLLFSLALYFTIAKQVQLQSICSSVCLSICPSSKSNLT
jgi:hypothetical protein